MAVAFSQHALGHFNTTQLGPPSNGSLVLPSVANGDVILLCAMLTNAGVGFDSVSGCGATWTELQFYGANNNVTFDLWIGRVGTASGSTVSFGQSTKNVIIDAEVMSFTGATQGAIDSSQNIGPQLFQTTIQGSSSRPFESGQAVATFLSWPSFNGGSGTPSGGYSDSPSAWTTVDELDGSGNNTSLDSAYVITTGAGTYSRTVTYTDRGASQSPMAFTVLLSADPFPNPPPPAHVVQKGALIRAGSW